MERKNSDERTNKGANAHLTLAQKKRNTKYEKVHSPVTVFRVRIKTKSKITKGPLF